MIFCGIDVAKDKHDCHIFSSDGEILCDNFSFPNSLEGFRSFHSLLSKCSNGNLDKIKVGLESTGHYSTNLLSFLKQLQVSVTLFNPLSVSQSRRACSLRRTKTDINDARYIAQLLVSDRSSPYHEQLYHISSLKSLTRTRFRLNKELQPLKNRYRRSVHILFPELSSFFCNLYTNSCLSLLEVLPSAKDIASCNITKLSNILSSASHGRFKKEKALQLKQLATSSIASYNLGDAFELKLLIQRIRFLEMQKAELEKEIERILSELHSPITSIPGIGNVLGATILAEIGDINNFSSPAKLLAFAGCDPSTYQSGKFVAKNTPMVKHGSRYLRNALYLATTAAYISSPSFQAYISKKKEQGKHHYVAISHGMKKMSRVIFSVLKSNVPFVERF